MTWRGWMFLAALLALSLYGFGYAARSALLLELGRRQEACALDAERLLNIPRSSAKMLCAMLGGL
jgi:hypothetical protein